MVSLLVCARPYILLLLYCCSYYNIIVKGMYMLYSLVLHEIHNIANTSILICRACNYIYYAMFNIVVEGRVTTPLPEVSPVCDGGHLQLNCTITGSLLEWAIIPDQNRSQLSTQRYVSAVNRSFQYGDSIITITVISHPMEQYYSGIVISLVYGDFDGAKVKCTDLEEQESSSSTVITVVSAQGIYLTYRC